MALCLISFETVRTIQQQSQPHVRTYGIKSTPSLLSLIPSCLSEEFDDKASREAFLATCTIISSKPFITSFIASCRYHRQGIDSGTETERRSSISLLCKLLYHGKSGHHSKWISVANCSFLPFSETFRIFERRAGHINFYRFQDTKKLEKVGPT